jgi:hypothetical protein
MSDEEKNFINKNRDIYNSGKRTYRIIIESNGKVIEVFIKLNPKSIQRIIHLMGSANEVILIFQKLIKYLNGKKQLYLQQIN